MQFIYTMKGLGKVHPPDHVVLKDIWLSFLPGAKIGVLGLNGAGKSTLLRIMAGEDQQFVGEAWPAEGITIGFLPQEPRLDESKTVLGNVEEGVSEIKALLTRYDEINARFGEDLSPEEMDKVLEEQGKVQDRIEAANGWDLDSRLELAMDALRLPPADADVRALSGGERRRVALCRLLLKSPDLLLLDEPTNHLDAESSPGSSASSRIIRARSSRSPTIGIFSTTWPDGFSNWIADPGFHGRATTRPGSNRSRSGSRSKRRLKRNGSAPSPASWTGFGCRRARDRRRARPA
jgi:ABC-type multidrug transport system ATPase subunit